MMDKTIKINLAGVLFQIDEQAYHMLRHYLQAINTRFRNVPGGNETIDDIEARIAEIFQSQQGLTGVISKENVEAMISILGKPEDFDQTESTGAEANKKNPKTEFYSSGVGSENQVNKKAKNVGGAFNEIFKALGKFFFIFFRIITIIIGISFVIIGFITILTLILVFFFKNPGFITSHAISSNFFFLPDFLNFIVNPSLTPWICVLSFLAVVLPLLALIYWGIKMIFWFRARDGVLSLIGLIIWALSVTALAIILANEGFSFSETGRTSSQIILENSPDTLYIITDRKVKDLEYDREVSFPDDYYTVFTNKLKNQLSVRVNLRLFTSDDNSAKVEVRKRSGGRSRLDAVKKAESLLYNYRVKNDTLFLDEYFSLPPQGKWSADDIRINLFLPERTIIFFDETSENLFGNHIEINSETDYDTEPWELGNKYWVITGSGLKEPGKDHGR